MDLHTEYLGLKLESPLMPGASPLADSLDVVRRLEDAGASAIIMRSLFEEQITREMTGNVYAIETHADSFAEAISYFPTPAEFDAFFPAISGRTDLVAARQQEAAQQLGLFG